MRIAIKKGKGIAEGLGFMKSDPVITYDHMHEVKHARYTKRTQTDYWRIMLFLIEEVLILSMALAAILL